MRCGSRLRSSLRTVAPRVAYYKHKKPGQDLPGPVLFAREDGEFCKHAGLTLSDFQFFKPRWAGSSEGAELCRHER